MHALFDFLTNWILEIIYGTALIQSFLCFALYRLIHRHQNRLMDSIQNLFKGFQDAPDKNSALSIAENLSIHLQFMQKKFQTDPNSKKQLAKNVHHLAQRPIYQQTYRIETLMGVISTLVQVFPLLGILGTILAIAQSAFNEGGTLDPQSLSKAFVIAMDTTILGIGFAVIFMIVESIFTPRVERVLTESHQLSTVIHHIELGTEAWIAQ